MSEAIEMEEVKNNHDYQLQDWIILGLIIFLGIFLRFFDIDSRPFHHDESLNAIYGRYAYAHPTIQYYKYDPMLHGPFLYNVFPFFYQIFGVSIATARMFMAFMGSFLLFLPLIFRRLLDKKIVFLFTLFIATAPSMIYWSRFIRHDNPMMIAISLSFIAFLFKCPWKKAFFFITPFFLQFTIKENAYIHLVLVLAYLVYETLTLKVLKSSLNPYAQSVKKFLQQNWKPVLAASVLGSFFYILFFTSYFQHREGILDGLYRKSLTYWFEQHNKDRIAGPFIYQIIFMSWYEQIFLFAVLAQVFHFYYKRQRNLQIFFGSLVLVAIILQNLIPMAKYNSGFISSVLKLKTPIDVYPFILVSFHAVIASTVFLKEGKQRLAFLSYLFTSTLFTYSLVGEKVPWLSLYPIFFGLIFLAFYLQEETNLLHNLFRKKWGQALLIVLLLFQVRMAVITNYSRAGEASEFISQVHTTYPYHELSKKIQHQLKFPLRADVDKLTVLALKENTWPLTWYLYELEGFRYFLGGTQLKDFKVVLTSESDQETAKALSQSHDLIKVPLRWWWVPSYSTMTLKNWLVYSFSHNPWTPVGQLYIHMYLQKGYKL